MNNEEKRLVAALRSGDYIQGFRQLKTRTADTAMYCCLGVYCQITFKFEGEFVFTGSDSYKKQYLPKEAIDMLNWADEKGTLDFFVRGRYGDTTTTNLTELNDSHEFTFNQIADIIAAGLVKHKEDVIPTV